MNAVPGFIFLLSLIASCHFFPLTEFDIDLQEIERLNPNCTDGHQKPMEPNCQWLNISRTMSCTDLIEQGLCKLNMVCNISDSKTHKTCRILERLKNLVTTDQRLCKLPMPQCQFLNYIRTVYQRANSIPVSQSGKS